MHLKRWQKLRAPAQGQGVQVMWHQPLGGGRAMGEAGVAAGVARGEVPVIAAQSIGCTAVGCTAAAAGCVTAGVGAGDWANAESGRTRVSRANRKRGFFMVRLLGRDGASTLRRSNFNSFAFRHEEERAGGSPYA
jgi:hypothetical protein